MSLVDSGNVNDVGPANFFSSSKPFLVRCYVCEPVRGTENVLTYAASGRCAWCGASMSNAESIEELGNE